MLFAVATLAALSFSAPPRTAPRAHSVLARSWLPALRPLAPPCELGRAACVRSIRMDGDTPDDLIEYSLRMVGFAASAVAGLVFTIFVAPVQAFMRNPRTATITGIGVGALGVLLLITLHAMNTNDVPLPREAAEQVNFNAFTPPTFQ